MRLSIACESPSAHAAVQYSSFATKASDQADSVFLEHFSRSIGYAGRLKATICLKRIMTEQRDGMRQPLG